MDALVGKGIPPSMTKQLYLACEKGELAKVTQHLESGISVDAPLDDVGQCTGGNWGLYITILYYII